MSPRRKKRVSRSVGRSPKRSARGRKVSRTAARRTSRNARANGLGLETQIAKEIWAVIYLAIGFLLVLSVRGNLGIVGEVVHTALLPVFGWGLYLVPAIFFLWSLFMFFGERSQLGLTRILGASLMGLAVLSIIHNVVPETELYSVAQAGEYGGYVGFVGVFLVRTVLGMTGAYVVFVALFIISLLLTFEVSVGRMVVFMRERQEKKKGEKEGGVTPKYKRVLEALENVVEDKMKKGDAEPEIKIVKPEKSKEQEEDVVVLREVEEAQAREEEAKTEEDPEIEFLEEDKAEEVDVNIVRPEDDKAAKLDTKGALVSSEELEWEYPGLDLLHMGGEEIGADDLVLKENADVIRAKLREFGIEVTMHDVHVGPTVIQYTLKPSEGVKLSKITGLKNDLALALASRAVRIEAPIPGKALVGIEVPNETRSLVYLKDILESAEWRKNAEAKLKVCFGRDVSGKAIVEELDKMPHVLIAGQTGSGKSVGVNAFLISLLYQNSPAELKFIMVDPKRVELVPYNGIPHLLTPVITDPEKAAISLRWTVAEMNRRYQVLSDTRHRNIKDYNENEKMTEKMPYIVVVIDELADLMMAAGKEVEASICRVAQMGRAVGLHLIVATQRPSTDVITGLIKANIPARVAFTVASMIDSRVILDTPGAEDLLGRGDMLYLAGDMSKPIRVQGVFITTKEVEQVTNRVKLTVEPDYMTEITSKDVARMKLNGIPRKSVAISADDVDDDMFQDAVTMVLETGKASASLLQRRLKLGYARAARLLDIMEAKGIVGPADGAKPREIMVRGEEVGVEE